MPKGARGRARFIATTEHELRPREIGRRRRRHERRSPGRSLTAGPLISRRLPLGRFGRGDQSGSWNLADEQAPAAGVERYGPGLSANQVIGRGPAQSWIPIMRGHRHNWHSRAVGAFADCCLHSGKSFRVTEGLIERLDESPRRRCRHTHGPGPAGRQRWEGNKPRGARLSLGCPNSAGRPAPRSRAFRSPIRSLFCAEFRTNFYSALPFLALSDAISRSGRR